MEKPIELAVEVMTSYVSRNHIQPEKVPDLLLEVIDAFRACEKREIGQDSMPPTPAVPLKKSVTEQVITCLFCGKSFRSLRRHVGNEHRMTPEQYRAHWNLPQSYPMVASEYSEKRSVLAKRMGLGKRREGSTS